MQIEVTHDTENKKFTAIVDNKECYLRYRMRGEDKIDLYYTYVPYDFRGRGIASEIVKEAFNFARENALIVIPTCPYIWTFLERHSEFHDIIIGS